MHHNLRDLRRAAGLTQKALANEARVSRDSVIRHEAGETKLDEATIVAYCRVLKCTPNDLLNYQQAS